MLDALDADAVHRWSRVALDLLDRHRAEIDALNVFPVPDSDTGANMLATVRAAQAALADATAVSDAASALAALADGAAMGALGNSGFITSQVLRGLANAAKGAPRCDGQVVATGLTLGAELARTAVVEPVDGTVLSVARAAAGAATGVGDHGLAAVVTAAVHAADGELQKTTAQLAELARAGVVDAGGRGFVVLLNALAEVVTGELVALTPVRPPSALDADHIGHADDPHGDPHDHSDAHPVDEFEVQFEVHPPAGTIEGLRAALSRIGDSAAVVPTADGGWRIHVHVRDVGAAIEAGLDVGRPSGIEVNRLVRTERATHRGHERPTARPVLAVAPGMGLRALFEAAGIGVVDGGPDDRPAAEDVVAAMSASGAHEFVLLPDAARGRGVAEAAAAQARASGRRVAVVSTRSPVQTLAAAAVHDASRRFDDDVVAMAETAAATRHAELVVATQDGLTAVGICRPGDVLGLIDGEIVEIGRGMLAVAFTVVDRLLGVGAELMTVLVGAGAPAGAGQVIEAHIRRRAPFTDVAVFDGGQGEHPVIIGVE